MKKTFTPNDLILYTYNETNETEKKELKQAIEENGFLKKQKGMNKWSGKIFSRGGMQG